MADSLARRAYLGEIAALRRNVARACDDVDRHVATIRAWADNPNSGQLPQPRNLGADVAVLVEHAAALKALLDANYLVED